METFYKVCVILLIIGGVNWGLVGLFSFAALCSPWWAWRPCAPFRACAA